MASNYTQISTIKAAYSSGYAASQGSYNATTGSPTFTVIQVVYYGTGTLSSPSVTDNQGNTWTLVYNAGWTPSGSGDANCLIFACANPTLSTTYSWTVTLASSGTFHLMAVWTGYSGGVPSSLTPLATTWGTLTSSANYINVASNYTLTSGNKGALIIMMGGGPNSDGSGVGTGTAPPYGGTAGNGSFNSFNNGSQYGHVGGSAAGGFYGMWHSDSSTTYNNSCYAYMGSDHCFAGTIMFGPPSTTPNSYTQNLTETALSFTETFVAGNNLNKSYSETAFPLTETFSAAHTYGLSLAETDLSFVETFVTLHRETVGTKYYFLVMSPESVALSENVAEHHTYSKLITDALGILSEPFIIGKSFLRTYTEAIFPLTETFRKAIVPNPLPTDSITLNDLTVNTKHGFNPSLGLDQFTISDLTLTAQHYVSESLSDYAGFGETSFTTYHNRAVSISETAFPLTETFSIATHIHYTQTFAETSFGISDALAPNSLSYPFTEVGTVTPNEVGFT